MVNGKNMCALNPQECPNVVEHMTLQQMIKILQSEIDKGSAVYSKAELSVLSQRLTNVTNALKTLTLQ